MNGYTYTCDANGNIVQKSIINGELNEVQQPQAVSGFASGVVSKGEDDKKLYRQPVDDIVKYIESTEARGASSQKAKMKGKQRRKDEEPDQTVPPDEGLTAPADDFELAEGGKKKRRRKNRKKNKHDNQEDSDEVQEHSKAASGAAMLGETKTEVLD